MLRSHYHFRTETLFPHLLKVLTTDSSQLSPLLRNTTLPKVRNPSAESACIQRLVNTGVQKLKAAYGISGGLCWNTTQLLPLIHPASFISPRR